MHRTQLTSLAATLVVLTGVTTLAQDAPVAVNENSSAEAEAVVELSSEERSALLRENLEETVREGERVLRDLPESQLRVARQRLTNLRRQLERKQHERAELEDTLARMRADYFRRTAALRASDEALSPELIERRQARLKSDYELHAESFEDELSALSADIEAISQTIRSLESRTQLAENLRQLERPVETQSEAQSGERMLTIPERLHPFPALSFVPFAKGKQRAPMHLLWALRGEIARQQGDDEAAARYWRAALDSARSDAHLERALAIALASLEYDRHDFAASTAWLAQVVGDREPAELSEAEAYAAAVLEYLNGRANSARQYLGFATPEDRERMSEFVSVEL